MILTGFLLTSTGLCLVLGFLVQFRSYRKSFRLLLLSLSSLFTVHIWAAYAAVFSSSPERWLLLHRALMALSLVEGFALVALTRHFLRSPGEDGETSHRLPVTYLAAVAAGVGALRSAAPGLLEAVREEGEPTLLFSGIGIFIPGAAVLMSIATLVLLESTYRFARDYQRKIGRLCFVGIGLIGIFYLLIFSRVLLYHTLPPHFAEASSIVCGVVFPVVLAGFLRYRLGSEQISIPRGTVYSSATMFLAGAGFLGVALTAFVFRWFDLDLNYFERFLLLFTLGFLLILVLGSGTMRKRISRLINEQLYSRKYDYQDQFYRLHKTMMAGATVDLALTELVETMKYSVTVDDACIFVLNGADGNFYMHENKEESGRRGLFLTAESPLIRVLKTHPAPLDLLGRSPGEKAARSEALREPLVGELGFHSVFPIFIEEEAEGERLAGLLALQGPRARPFDREDLDLIGVFTASIGNALFRNRAILERIEQKQFESFHHVASFIIHDIKNQVATLNLILKNAERNIENPRFQASMLSSVRSCAVNLQSLIDRLALAPREQHLQSGIHSIREVLREVLANSGLEAPPAGLEVRLEGEDAQALMDRRGVFFVVKNLVNNALEAMQAQGESGPRGSLVLRCGASAEPGRVAALAARYGRGEEYFAPFAAYILVTDSGPGMEADFIQRRLFQPFVTTKEKGVGIGLFQCKSLVEKMGGRILCRSNPGDGTEFCILLPQAKG